jgi:hypothetical protein
MITSEVQRTLVKSPPELWSELSDPTALGRHLGEFGEIRITRVEPETTVEWEAENASGAVVIKPSGWGTRVILRASRESPVPQAQAEADAAAMHGREADSEVEAAAGADAAPEAEVTVAAETAPEADAGPETHARPETDAASEMDAAPETDAAPESNAAPELSADEPSWPTQAGLEHVLGPVTHAGLAHGGGRWQEPDWEDEAQPEPRVELEPTERRGLFARLFRRRSRRFSAEPEWAEKEAASETHPDGAPDELASLPDGGYALPAVTDQDFRAAEIEPGDPAPEHPDAPATVPTDANAEHLEAVARDIEEPVTTADEAAEAGAVEPEQLSDGAAQLEAGEQAAAEEVTAVLTSMLDRLGTAHHRPFSRA